MWRSSVSSPAGRDAPGGATRPITPPGSGRTSSGRLEKTQPSLLDHVGQRRRAVLRGDRLVRVRDGGGEAPAGERACGATPLEQGGAPPGPPRIWTNCIGASTSAKRSTRRRERASASRSRRRARLPARALGQRGEQLRVGVERGDLVARPRRGRSATRPVPAPRSRIGPPASRGELAPELEVGRVGAVLDVVPDHGAGRSLRPPLGQAAPGEQVAQLEQRRVGGQREEALARRPRRRRRRATRSRSRSTTSSARRSRRTSAAAPSPRPACPSRSRAGRGRRSTSKSASQIQETSRPSAIRSLSASQRSSRAVLERERAQHLVRAGRVLDQQDRQLAAVDRDRLDPPEGPAEALERRAHGGERHAELERAWRRRRRRCRRCRGRGGGGAASSVALPACAASTLRAAHPVERHAGGRHVRRPGARARSSGSGSGRGGRGRSRRSRRRAPQLRQCLESAACCMLGQRLGVVLDAEVGRRPRGSRPRSATSGSSAFSTKPRAAVEPAHQLGPAVGEQLELAVAVELVAEQVGEQEQARVQRRARPAAARPRRPRTARAGRRSRPASSSAVATPQAMFEPGAVVDHRPPGPLEARRRSSPRWWSCRWWPRRARSPRRARVPCGRARRARARSSRRPGAVVPPLRPSRRLAARSEPGERCGRGGTSGGRRTITRRQRGSHARSVAGVAPIGSPSA